MDVCVDILIIMYRLYALMKKAVRTSEASVYFYETIRCISQKVITLRFKP
jgi:hypothetical protein